MFRRFDLKTEVALATVPAVMIIAVLMLLETFSKQQLLFSSLASSAVSSALIFAFQYTKPDTLMLFLFAVLLLVILIVLQRISIWIIKKKERKET